jgi:glycine betaine/proline transport system substrate-binding protein
LEQIIFADLSWESAQVHNRIAAFILENGYGYPKSDYIPGDTIPLFLGLTRGDVHVNMELWTENQQEAYDEAIAAREVVDLGDNYWDNWQGWLVPTYMIENGQLPADISVDDMPDYWELFKDREDPNKGAFYSCIAGWECEKINEEKFKEYGLDEYYNVILPGSGAALLASMVGAYEKGEPWFGYYWAPTAALGKLDMTPIEEPPYDEQVWETNHACAYPAVHVNILVNAEWFDNKINAAAAEFLTNYSTTTAQNNQVLAFMEENKASIEEAAIYFLQNFKSVWKQWIPFPDVIAKVEAALP